MTDLYTRAYATERPAGSRYVADAPWVPGCIERFYKEHASGYLVVVSAQPLAERKARKQVLRGQQSDASFVASNPSEEASDNS